MTTTLRQHEIAEADHRILHPLTDDKLMRSHLAYQRDLLGWGVFVLRPAG